MALGWRKSDTPQNKPQMMASPLFVTLSATLRRALCLPLVWPLATTHDAQARFCRPPQTPFLSPLALASALPSSNSQLVLLSASLLPANS
jgi:hypothetical protein